MKLTLIITTYNWPDSLLLVIESVKHQSIIPDEIIIADDGSVEDTRDLIIMFQKNSNLNIIHSWQKDAGFRVARSRNKAIALANGEYIILIDGDMILHKDFLKDHVANAESGCFIQGTRVLLSKKETIKALAKKNVDFSFFSPRLKNRKNSIRSKILSLIFTKKKNHLRGIKSCNMAFYRKDCININGFNNDFEGWGREDSEFIVRLIKSGIKRKNVRFNAIQFHLWHNESSRVSLKINNDMLQNAINSPECWCENGINALENNES
jgi:glycosyltransferase involved in cell wall biosynthesis